MNTPKQSEIWLVELDPTRGAEIQKTRPALIVGKGDMGTLPLRIVVPITGWNDGYVNIPWLVRLTPTLTNGLRKESAADAFQVKSLSQERFVRRLGSITREQLASVIAAITLCIEIEDE
jgi:mRNA interferase MazF